MATDAASPGQPVVLAGVSHGAQGAVIAALRKRRSGSLLVVTPDAEQSERVLGDLATWLHGDEVSLEWFPPGEHFSEPGEPVDAGVIRQRLCAVAALRDDRDCIVVTTLHALCQPTIAAEDFEAAFIMLKVGETCSLTELTERLTGCGFRRRDLVDSHGEFAVRGGILDVFPGTGDLPYRIEFFGDDIESIRTFDVDSQRSIGEREQALITPPRELRLAATNVAAAETRMEADLAHQVSVLESQGEGRLARQLEQRVRADLESMRSGFYFPGVEAYHQWLAPSRCHLHHYLPADGAVVVCEPDHVLSAAQRRHASLLRRWEEAAHSGAVLVGRELPSAAPETVLDHLRGLRRLDLSMAGEGARLELTPAPAFQSRFDLLTDQIVEWVRDGKSVWLVSNHRLRVEELLRDHDLTLAPAGGSHSGGVSVMDGSLHAGFHMAQANLVVLSDSECFGWQKRRRRWRRGRPRSSLAIDSLADLQVGDYVVHINHGIGIYRGPSTQTVFGEEAEYLHIQYAGEDSLYVPVSQIDRVQKYVGSEGADPPLNSLRGKRWQKTKQRVRQRTAEMAKELAELYAAREAAEGIALGDDSPWQRELESSFEFEETPDQLRAIAAVKADLSRPRPTDRLICGDVGFGKTEVAIRAAFKMVVEGKQVAVLAPTTVLAQQHYHTFRDRLRPFPVNVEVLSRFRTPTQQRRTVERVATGEVDIVVGTHRLLSRDLEFKDLGLLVIDEEQRFGVRHKEALKKLRTSVDVLTLTATPIPRTLHMALGGLRDLSIIEDPPAGRLPIRTVVSPYHDDLVQRAIRRELDRDGQVYFVHNRIESIPHVAYRLQRLVPEARLAIAHGQLPNDELEEVMVRFMEEEYDVLLCTTIIENGLDIPNVNTLIVDRCDHFGLAQLYQLRGRVGRSDRQASAYFLYSSRGQLTPAAELRLDAIQEFSDLGSGFKIAMRDLEIRGAGNLLGGEQHGFMEAVGLDLYCEMLAEAVAELKQEPKPAKQDLPEVDLPVSCLLPHDYVADIGQRMDLYRRMTRVTELDEVSALAAELRDRFGPLPREARSLLQALRLRVIGRGIGLRGVRRTSRASVILLPTPVSAEMQVYLYTALSDSFTRDELETIQNQDRELHIALDRVHGQRAVHLISRLVEAVGSYYGSQSQPTTAVAAV